MELAAGVEPAISRLRGGRFSHAKLREQDWSVWVDSNHRSRRPERRGLAMLSYTRRTEIGTRSRIRTAAFWFVGPAL